jgi:flagellar motor switch protein FliG
MLAIGDVHAGKLLQMMDDDEIRALSQQMAHLGNINSEAVEVLLHDFSEHISSAGALVGTFESTERLLSKNLDPERVKNLMEEIRGPSGRTMWDKLGNVNEAVLANYLKNEYPQTVAVVLSKVKPMHAARVLALLPENFALEVVMRMLRMAIVQRGILDEIERTLRTEFMSNLARTNRGDAHELVTENLQQLRSRNGKPVHDRARGAQPGVGAACQATDVHLRGPATTGCGRCAGPAAASSQGAAGRCA